MSRKKNNARHSLAKTNVKKVEAKGYGSPYSSGGSFPAYADSYRKQRSPTARVLVEEYEDVVYACANLNAQTLAATPLRLYLRTSKGQQNRFWQTKSLGKFQRDYLNKKLNLNSGHKIEEVLDHPILDLLNNPNEDLDLYTLLKATQGFQEIVGTGFWYVPKDSLGRPQEIEYLNSQYVVMTRDTDGKPINYCYCGKTYLPDEIISFPMFNPNDRWVGYSPLRASWEQVNIANKLDSTQAALLDNDGMPRYIVSPSGEDSFMGDDIQNRLARKWGQRFAMSQGGPLFSDEPIDIKTISYTPRDLSALQIKASVKETVCNAFGVPVALLQSKDFNKANLEGSRLMHVANAITDRVRQMESRLNKYLVSKYDPSGRLFLMFDDPSPENRQEKQSELAGYVSQNIITRNEARSEIGLEPHEDGDGLFPIQPGMQGLVNGKPVEGKPSAGGEESQAETPEAQPTDTAAGATPVADVQGTALNGAQVTSLLEIANQVAAGQLPIDTARALISVAFPEVPADKIDGIINPLIGFEPEKPEPVSAPQAGKPTVQPQDDPEEEAKPEKPVADDKPEPKGKSFLPVINKAMEFGLPDGHELEEVVSKFFQKKRLQIVGSIEKGYSRKSLPSAFVGLDDWTEELGTMCKPLIELYLSTSAKELLGRVGASPDMFDVTSPHIQEAVSKAVFAFSQSTIESTSKELNSALTKLREDVAAGLVSPDNRLSDLTKTVNGIFEGLSTDRAFQIATTEASRAHHLGAQLGAEESGVVRGKRWLLSSDACPECMKYKDKEVALKGDFGTREQSSEAYQSIPYPPLHCRCACSMEMILDVEE